MRAAFRNSGQRSSLLNSSASVERNWMYEEYGPWLEMTRRAMPLILSIFCTYSSEWFLLKICMYLAALLSNMPWGYSFVCKQQKQTLLKVKRNILKGEWLTSKLRAGWAYALGNGSFHLQKQDYWIWVLWEKRSCCQPLGAMTTASTSTLVIRYCHHPRAKF